MDPTRQMSLDFLEGDFMDFAADEELIPVDDFFNSYVETLGLQGQQAIFSGSSEGDAATLNGLSTSSGLEGTPLYPEGQASVPIALPIAHVAGRTVVSGNIRPGGGSNGTEAIGSFDPMTASQNGAHPLRRSHTGSHSGSGNFAGSYDYDSPVQLDSPTNARYGQANGFGGGNYGQANGFVPNNGNPGPSGRTLVNLPGPAVQGSTVPGGASVPPSGSGRGRGRGRGRSAEADMGPRKETKTKRNARQQVQNKQAQARYRERRKNRFMEMEQTIEELTQQLAGMQAIQDENKALQGRTVDLEQTLAARELEIEQLRAKVAKVWGVCSSVGEETAMAGSEGAHGECGSHNAAQGEAEPATVTTNEEVCTGECPVQYEEQERARVAADNREKFRAEIQRFFAQHMERLQQFVEQHGLKDADPFGNGVPEEVQKQLRTLVNMGMAMAKRAVRADGVHILELMSKTLNQVTHVKCAESKARWMNVLETLRMTPEQEERILALRKQQLGKLRVVYEQRQALNLTAMGLMLPAPGKKGPNIDPPTLENKMECMSLAGHLYCIGSSANLSHVLDDIRANLRSEQLALAEMNFCTLHKILTPIQTALFIMGAQPHHPDCLALSNVIARKNGRQDSLEITCKGTAAAAAAAPQMGWIKPEDGEVVVDTSAVAGATGMDFAAASLNMS